MIVSLLRLPCLAAFATLGGWILWLAANANEPFPPELEERAFAGLYANPEVMLARRGWAERASLRLRTLLPLGVVARLHALEPGLRTTALHAHVCWDLLPIAAHLAFAGVLAGAVLRERLRSSNGSYASPTACFLGRAAVSGGGLYLLVFAFTPLPAPYGTLYLAILAISVGGFLYAGNLPLKL